MVKINDMYYVYVEDKNLTLQKVVGTDKRTVKTKYNPVGYYTNWPALFDALIKLFVAEKVNLEKVISLSQLKNIYEEIRKEIKGLLADQF
ncbi:MAG: hypothetical protein ACM3XR_02150 [Bacillota bacterium]